MILEIKTFPSEILRKKAEEVTEFNEELHLLLDNMFETMYQAKGIGLAAPQVGVSKRFFVLDDMSGAENKNPMEIINPVFLEKEGEILEEEGCLSIPCEYAYVKRYMNVKVKYQDRFGNEKIIEATDRLSRILQHESDHLDGTLFIDRLPNTKRETIKKHVKKRINQGDYQVNQ